MSKSPKSRRRNAFWRSPTWNKRSRPSSTASRQPAVNEPTPMRSTSSWAGTAPSHGWRSIGPSCCGTASTSNNARVHPPPSTSDWPREGRSATGRARRKLADGRTGPTAAPNTKARCPSRGAKSRHARPSDWLRTAAGRTPRAHARRGPAARRALGDRGRERKSRSRSYGPDPFMGERRPRRMDDVCRHHRRTCLSRD